MEQNKRNLIKGANKIITNELRYLSKVITEVRLKVEKHESIDNDFLKDYYDKFLPTDIKNPNVHVLLRELQRHAKYLKGLVKDLTTQLNDMRDPFELVPDFNKFLIEKNAKSQYIEKCKKQYGDIWMRKLYSFFNKVPYSYLIMSAFKWGQQNSKEYKFWLTLDNKWYAYKIKNISTIDSDFYKFLNKENAIGRFIDAIPSNTTLEFYLTKTNRSDFIFNLNWKTKDDFYYFEELNDKWLEFLEINDELY